MLDFFRSRILDALRQRAVALWSLPNTTAEVRRIREELEKLERRLPEGERPGTPGATSRSNCPSRWTPSAPSSSMSIRATRPRPRSAPGVRRTANSGRRSGSAVAGSKSLLSPGPGRSSTAPRRCSATGLETHAHPNTTRRSAWRSPGSSRSSSRGISGCSRRCAAISRADSGEWASWRSGLAGRQAGG